MTIDDEIDKRLIEVPYKRLSPEALQGILEEYSTRGGYESEIPLHDRLAVLHQKLEKGLIKIVFDPVEESINVIPATTKTNI
ncbi:YheU family protein [bacterium]|nr:YheU family protein [bacterium]